MDDDRPRARHDHAVRPGRQRALRQLTIVAFYGPKPDALLTVIEAVQAAVGDTLGRAFRPRPLDDVHATIIGLESPGADVDATARFVDADLRAAPLEVQFGGFAPDDTRLLSRGTSLYERGITIGGPLVILMGWPVEDGRPSTRLGILRARCAEYGAAHKYGALDPDVYLVVGAVDPGIVTAAATEAARAKLHRPTRIPLTAADAVLVAYDDPVLPRATSTCRPLR